MRIHHLLWRAAALFCAAALLGSLIAAWVDTELLRKPFGILLLATGLRELLYRPQRRR